MPNRSTFPFGIQAAIAIIAAATLSACATQAPQTPEQIVSQRAQNYWDARIAGDKAKAYGYTHPSYKQVYTEKDFGQQYPGTFAKSVTVKKVECDAEKCDVGINMRVVPPIIGNKMAEVDMYATETWLLTDGQWWIYIKP